MRNIKILTAIVLLTAALITGTLAAKSGSFNILLDGRRTSARTVVHEGELYISVQDLSRMFPERIRMDSSKGQLEFFSLAPDRRNPVPAPPPSGSGVQGEILLREQKGSEYPVRGVEVILFTHNPSVPAEMTDSLVKSWAKGKDNVFSGSHGKVRQATTGTDGRFYLASVPPGTYEIAAIYFTVRGKSGRFWRKKITVGKDETVTVKFDSNGALSLD